MKIKIKKVVISDLSLKVTYCKIAQTEAGDVSDDITIKGGGLAHSDFVESLNKLKIHFAALCDFREVPPVADYGSLDIAAYTAQCDLENIFITGVQITGSYEKEAIEIIGNKIVEGKTVSLTSPKAKAHNDNYPFVDNLFEVVEEIKHETNEYLFSAKYTIKQEAMQFEDDSMDDYEYSADSEYSEDSE